MNLIEITRHFKVHGFHTFYEKFLKEMKAIGGDEYQAICPFHNDSKPSLCFNDEKGTFFCHGCGAKGDAIGFFAQLFGYDQKKDFPKVLKQIAAVFNIGRETTPRIVEEYDYTDEKGTLLFQVVRYDPKDFRQRRPNGKNGWIWNLNGTRKVLYRLPDILRATRDWICIVEGEKDANNLRELGFYATTSPGGAKGWSAEYNEALKSKCVVLIPDNDEPGRQYMEKVARSLYGTAARIKLLDLPDLPEKGDISDWLERYDDRNKCCQDLLSLIDQAPLYAPKDLFPLVLAGESNPDRLTFPGEVIGGVAGRFAEIYSNSLESPPEFFYMAFLACLGAVLSGRLTLHSELAPQPRMFVVILGESADDRKSTACNKTVQFYKDVIADFPVCYGIGSAEGLAQLITKSPGGRLLLYYDEFKAFVSKSLLQGSVLLPMVNTLFEGNAYENHTKDRSVSLSDAHLSLLGASTVQTYENTWTSQFTDIGFNNRLFLIPGRGRRQFSLPARVSEVDRRELAKKLGEILAVVGNGLELSLTQEAETHYHQGYMALEPSIHSKRLDTYATRFMPLLALNQGKEQVDGEVVEQVCRLMNWQLEVRRVHDPIDADNVIAKTEEKVRRCLNRRPMTNRELRQFCNVRKTGVWCLETAIKNLRGAGEIAWERAERRWHFREV